MSLTDPIGDMLARIKNSQMRNHKKVEMPSSNFKAKIADVLKNEGYINGFNIDKIENKSVLIIDLKYNSGNPVISVIERISKPGRRVYSSFNELPRTNGGLGTVVVSTSRGLLSDSEARKRKLGGELICEVWSWAG